MDNISTPVALAISTGIALLVAILVQFILVPMQRRKIMGQPVHFTFGDSDGNYPITVWVSFGAGLTVPRHYYHPPLSPHHHTHSLEYRLSSSI